MFGNKKIKQKRLDDIVHIIQSMDTTQQELANRLGVSPSTITDDLTRLEERGALLAEDGCTGQFLWVAKKLTARLPFRVVMS